MMTLGAVILALIMVAFEPDNDCRGWTNELTSVATTDVVVMLW